jgi:hypothetical protein
LDGIKRKIRFSEQKDVFVDLAPNRDPTPTSPKGEGEDSEFWDVDRKSTAHIPKFRELAEGVSYQKIIAQMVCFL